MKLDCNSFSITTTWKELIVFTRTTNTINLVNRQWQTFADIRSKLHKCDLIKMVEIRKKIEHLKTNKNKRRAVTSSSILSLISSINQNKRVIKVPFKCIIKLPW